MATINKENLDERIERIKKRNEEIEKKYREAEEDRLMALKDNAMVETKPPKDEDWPKGHKYDKIDFTYDVKPEKLEEQLNQKKPEEIRTKRDYKKFPDGEGPPPDPAYNFLADAERDGVVNQKNENKGERKDPRQTNRNKDLNNKRNGPGNNSFRGRGGKSHNPKYQKQNSQPEYEQWRSEREKIDEARINRQKVGDGKWRREWDNDKINAENEALLKPERVTLGDAINVSSKKSPTHSGKNTQHGGHHQITDCLVEKRGNITVSVSQTGEVKSVKLSSAPVIGTGRVGPRQPSKTQFSIQSVEKDVSVQPVPSSPRMQNKNNHKNTNNNHKAFAPTQHHNKGYPQSSNQKTSYPQKPPAALPQNSVPHSPTGNAVPAGVACPPSPLKNKRKQQNPKHVPHQPNVIVPGSPVAAAAPLVGDLPASGGNGVVPVDLSHKPEFAKRSVQDRLIRVRQIQNQQQKTTNGDEEKSNGVDEVSADSGVVATLPEATKKIIEESETNFDKANESIQAAEPIAACN